MSEEIVRESSGTLADYSVREVGRAILNELDMLRNRIAELESDNAEFRQLIRDWSIVLDQNDEFQLWQVESVRQAMLEINKEREK